MVVRIIEPLQHVSGSLSEAPQNTLKLTLSRLVALTASPTLQKYISDTNDPSVHQLEGILASFGRQT